MILVTGATGLVGSHLVLHLIENGESVRAIYRNPENIKKTKALFALYNKESLFDAIQWAQADITDIPLLENAFSGIAFVYHCAAMISFDPKEEDLIRKTNIEGTANIVNFCLAFNVKKLCFVSSIAALGDLKENETTITENTEWNPEKPHSDYAISKYGAEMEIWRGQQEGLNTVILNPGVILGPGFPDQGSGILFTKVANGLPFYTLGSTGFTAVTDVVRIAFHLMQNNSDQNIDSDDLSNPNLCERYTIVAENLIFQDVLNSIAASLKVKQPKFHAKPLLMEFGWRIDWVLSNIFQQKRRLSKATAKSSYTKCLYSNEKIKNALQWEFQGIHQYIREIANL